MAGTKRSGRKKKPAASKKLAGTYRKDRDTDALEVDANGIPPIPEKIHPRAAAEWSRLAPICQKAGLLTDADWMAWEAGFMSWSVVLNAWETLADPDQWEMVSTNLDTGQEYRQQVPRVAIFKQHWSQLMQFCREFGLTPSSRNGLDIDTGQKKTDDPMQTFLNG